MLIAGWAWVGASERGAFGFSNEKSLMYWPSTLSCAWPGWGPGPCGGPPLPGVVIATTSHRSQLPQVRGVANTGTTAGQGRPRSCPAHVPSGSLGLARFRDPALMRFLLPAFVVSLS